MVAYSFKKGFIGPIESGEKRQTIRPERKRHAEPGERLQIYYAMRTKHCRKIIEPDPVCLVVSPVEIHLSADPKVTAITFLAVNECEIKGDDLEAFAIADGFDPKWHLPSENPIPSRIKALTIMGSFWRLQHGPGLHRQVLITWRNADG